MNKEELKGSLRFDTKSIVMMGLLISTEVVLSRFASISVWNLKIGFGFVPLVIAAILMGPVKAGIVGALADFIGATLFPIGAYFIGFTITNFLTGFVYGLFLYKKQSLTRTIIAVAINHFILSSLLNTLWISILYGSPYLPLFMTRIIKSVMIAPIHAFIIHVLSKTSLRRLAWQG